MEPRAPVSVFRAGLLCRCPRCGRGRLFTEFVHFLRVAQICEACGLDLRPEDSGDGPAVFVMFLTGPLVVALAIVLEALFRPPLWLHAALWIPTVVVVSIALLRPLKAVLIALQYRHKAGEGGKNTFT
jgi:uncharacterized protein (DUF983 family)